MQAKEDFVRLPVIGNDYLQEVRTLIAEMIGVNIFRM